MVFRIIHIEQIFPNPTMRSLVDLYFPGLSYVGSNHHFDHHLPVHFTYLGALQQVVKPNKSWPECSICLLLRNWFHSLQEAKKNIQNQETKCNNTHNKKTKNMERWKTSSIKTPVVCCYKFKMLTYHISSSQYVHLMSWLSPQVPANSMGIGFIWPTQFGKHRRCPWTQWHCSKSAAEYTRTTHSSQN